jgi:hypothetical protein
MQEYNVLILLSTYKLCLKDHKNNESKNLHMLNVGNHHRQIFMFSKLGIGMSKNMANIRNLPFSELSLEK